MSGAISQPPPHVSLCHAQIQFQVLRMYCYFCNIKYSCFNTQANNSVAQQCVNINV